MEQIKWFDRQFDFSSTQNTFPSILERLTGTPARLEEKLSLIDPPLLSCRVSNTWTIKEHVGHLADLEPLWQGRLQDIIDGKESLRPADLQNTTTSQAGHDTTPVPDLLQAFRKVRADTLQLLEGLPEELVFKAALHPRLGTAMRTIDLFLFVAEHDDHHLARISALAKGSKGIK